MSKKTIFILLGSAIGIILLLVGLKKGGVIGNTDDSKIVELSKVAQTTIIETVSATGKIQPEIEVKISSEVSGEVIALPIKEGQQVKKGDLLVRINPDLYESGVNNVVGILGKTITKEQEDKLLKMPVTHLIILTDNDQAGRESKTQIQRQLGRIFKLTFPKISTKDVGEMTAEQIKKKILPQVKGTY